MTKDGFEQMIDAADTFFAELAQNNTKEWFTPRKAQYTSEVKKPADLFAEILAEDFSRISGRSYKAKQFRIYRDVRFSKDKTPLNAHLHLMWMPEGEGPFRPVFFFGSEPGRLDVGTGVMGFKGPDMARFRAFIDAWGDTLTDAIDASGMSLSNWGPEPLKRVPSPYDADHVHGDLLRRKALVISRALGNDWRGQDGGLVSSVRAAFEQTETFADLLIDHLG